MSISHARDAGGPLTLEASAGAQDGHIMEGLLRCSSCKAPIALEQGVPRLLPDPSVRSPDRENVAARFGYEWNRFCDFEYDEEVASLRTWFQPRRLEDLAVWSSSRPAVAWAVTP